MPDENEIPFRPVDDDDAIVVAILAALLLGGRDGRPTASYPAFADAAIELLSIARKAVAAQHRSNKLRGGG